MSAQLVIVLVCVGLAALFMLRKFYKSSKNRGCDCDGSCKNKKRACYGGAECPEAANLREIKPSSKG